MSSTADNTELYGYVPTKSVCYIFVILFGFSMILHLTQAIRYRARWLVWTAVLAALIETVGWSGRLWSSNDPLNQTPYAIQIISTIVAPTPLIGAIFITWGRLIRLTGLQYSRLNARLYSRIFLTCDIIGFFVQLGGGSLASSSDSNPKLGTWGANIMLGGIVFQLVSLTAFWILAAEYCVRYHMDRPYRSVTPLSNSSREAIASGHWTRGPLSQAAKHLIIGTFCECLFLEIRSIYRTIELADGFNGRIIQTQVYFNVLDGAMVVVAMYILSILHPARLLKVIGATDADSIPLALK